MRKLNKIMLNIISAFIPMGMLLMISNITGTNNSECLTAIAMMLIGCWAIVKKESI